MKTCEQRIDDIFAKAELRLAEKKRKTIAVRKYTAAASSICAAMAVCVGIYKINSENNAFDKENFSGIEDYSDTTAKPTESETETRNEVSSENNTVGTKTESATEKHEHSTTTETEQIQVKTETSQHTVTTNPAASETTHPTATTAAVTSTHSVRTTAVTRTTEIYTTITETIVTTAVQTKPEYSATTAKPTSAMQATSVTTVSPKPTETVTTIPAETNPPAETEPITPSLGYPSKFTIADEQGQTPKNFTFSRIEYDFEKIMTDFTFKKYTTITYYNSDTNSYDEITVELYTINNPENEGEIGVLFNDVIMCVYTPI